MYLHYAAYIEFFILYDRIVLIFEGYSAKRFNRNILVVDVAVVVTVLQQTHSSVKLLIVSDSFNIANCARYPVSIDPFEEILSLPNSRIVGSFGFVVFPLILLGHLAIIASLECFGSLRRSFVVSGL